MFGIPEEIQVTEISPRKAGKRPLSDRGSQLSRSGVPELAMQAGDAVAVVGATGFIGRALLARLREAGHRVVALVRRPVTFPTEVDPVELRQVDLRGPIDPVLLDGCRVLINLVGLKRPESGGAGEGFEVAHVTLPLALADAAEAAGVARMIHVSVAGADRPDAATAGPYLASKHRGERALRERAGALAITLIRPGVVYGPGDDMLRNLADGIRAAPVFPAPRGGRAELAPIDVDDVALGLLRCVERPATAGHDYDLVGPERLTLRAVIGRVAAAPSVARSCRVVAAPDLLLRPAAAVLERVARDPLITSGQLGLLRAGVVGDPEPARRALGLEPRPLDTAAIERALQGFVPRLPSVRLVPDPRATAALAELAGPAPGWASAGFGVLAVAALFAGPWLIPAIWVRMAALDLGLLLIAVLGLRLRWAALVRPTLAGTAAGVGAGAFMWLGAFAVTALLAAAAPGLWAGAGELYAWADALPLALALASLVVIVAGEEIIWRGALGLGLAARVGPWAAVAISAASFTLAHVSIGSPLLLVAAALAGGMWTALAIRTRSLWPCFLAHLIWDVGLLWVTPLG